MSNKENGLFSIFSLKDQMTRRNFLRFCAAWGAGLLAACAPKPLIEATTTASPVLPTALAKKETPTVTVRATPTIVVTTLTPESLTPAAIPTNIAEALPTVKVESKTEKAIKKLIKPFWENAKKTREEKAKNDKEWSKRVDSELNRNRVNFLLFGYGKSVEPPNPNLIDVGSHTIISINVDTGQIDIISFTHDIWDPEINNYLKNFGQPGSAQKIDRGFFIAQKREGNEKALQFMAKQVEKVTGLSTDHSVAFQDDEVFSDLIDNVFGGLEVTVLSDFKVQGYSYKGIRHDNIGEFKKGRERMSGERVAQFIKTVPYAEGAYGPELEHNVRKAIVFEALFKAILKQKGELGFQTKVLWFLGQSFFSDSSLNNMTDATGSSKEGLFKTSTYMVDPAYGDGGVQWVLAQAAVNPVIDNLVKNGVFPSRIDEQGKIAIDMEVPIGADPNGDYWESTRSLVKKTLTGQ